MKTILFTSTENKKRSQMAEAIFNHLAKERSLSVRAISAGILPAEEVDSHVTTLLSCHGIMYQEQKPKKLHTEMLEEAYLIISFGCLVPDMYPKEKFEEWLVNNPRTPEDYENTFRTIFQNVVAL